MLVLDNRLRVQETCDARVSVFRRSVFKQENVHRFLPVIHTVTVNGRLKIYFKIRNCTTKGKYVIKNGSLYK